MTHTILRTSVMAVAVLGLLWAAFSTAVEAQKVGPAARGKGKQPVSEGRTVSARPQDHLSALDIIVPVFDPNITDDDLVWPEVRRAEANRFAYMTKQALDRTGAFGATRVTPDATALGSLYVLGKITRSNGEDVRLSIEVVDISGRTWLRKKTFKHRVSEQFFSSPRNVGKDSYTPVFDEIARAIVAKLRPKKNRKRLEKLPPLAEMVFAQSFGSGYFAEYASFKKNRYKLKGLPSEDDPLYQRIKVMRVQEQMFVDTMQEAYSGFVRRMDPHYSRWQEVSLPIARERRQEKARRTWRAIGGVLLAGAAAASGNQDVATAGVLVGGALVGDALFNHREADETKAVLNELGATLNMDVGTQVVEFEGIESRLEGDAVEQFNQHRAHLQKIYDREITPDVDLTAREP